jgi:hypothetical protein
MEAHYKEVSANRYKNFTRKITYDVGRAKTVEISEGMEAGKGSDGVSGHDMLRRALLEGEKRREVREAEQGDVHIDRVIDQLGETASALLRRCYVQGLTEERFILSMLKRLKRCPEEVKRSITGMMHEHLPQENAEKIQTTCLFEWGRNYAARLYTSEVPELRQYLNSPRIHLDTARDAASHLQAVREKIIANPYQFLLLEESEGKAAQIRRERVTIDNGCGLSLAHWDEDRKEEREQFHAIMQDGDWRENFPDIWEKKPEEAPQIRTMYNLSLLQLTHQGYAVQSLEILQYVEKGSEENNEPIMREGIQHQGSRKKWYITSKLTTAGGDYYTPITERRPGLQDAGEQVFHLLESFLTGMEQDGLNTILREDDILAEDYWYNEDVNWRFIGKQYRRYFETLHPAIDQYTQHEIEDQIEQGAKRTIILDVAGGNGDLAERIIKHTHRYFPEHPIDYILIDLSEPDIRLANERFRALIALLGVEHITARAIQVDMGKYLPDAEATRQDSHREYRSQAEAMKRDLRLPQEGVNIVINSGGILNKGITNDAGEAANFLGVLTHIMKLKEGSGIYSGLTPLCITADTHNTVGGTKIHNLIDPYARCQMHVVRRV